MRRYSPAYYSPPRRGYGGRPRSPPRSPPRRGYGADRGRQREQNNGSLLVRNIPLDCRPEELRVPFERFGVVRDVYLPKNYYTGEPRGFAFVQFVEADDAAEAQYHMNGKIFAGRQITVVLAAETRKKPEEMRHRTRDRGPSGHGGQRSYGRSRSRSRSPRYASGSRGHHRSRSYSPSPRGRNGFSISPDRRHLNRPRSPPRARDINHNPRSYSPHYEKVADQDRNDYGKRREHEHESEDARAHLRSSPRRVSRSPSGSRSRSADMSPR